MIVRLAAIAILMGLAVAPVRAIADAAAVAGPAEVRALVAQGVRVVDIRRPDEWRETGVIDGSVLITAIDADGRMVDGFPQALAQAVGPDEPVVVICRSGNRSAAVSRMMRETGGYSQVVDAGGGIRAWLAEGLPVSPCPSC